MRQKFDLDFKLKVVSEYKKGENGYKKLAKQYNLKSKLHYFEQSLHLKLQKHYTINNKNPQYTPIILLKLIYKKLNQRQRIQLQTPAFHRDNIQF